MSDGYARLQGEHRGSTGEKRLHEHMPSNSDSYNDAGAEADWSAPAAVGGGGSEVSTEADDMWSASGARGAGTGSSSRSFEFDFWYNPSDSYSASSGSNDYDDGLGYVHNEGQSTSSSYSAEYEYATEYAVSVGTGSPSNSAESAQDPTGRFRPAWECAAFPEPGLSPRWDDLDSASSEGLEYVTFQEELWGGTHSLNRDSSADAAIRRKQSLGGSVRSDNTDLGSWAHDNVIHGQAAASSTAREDAEEAARFREISTRPASGAAAQPPPQKRRNHRTFTRRRGGGLKNMLDWSVAYDLLTGRVENTHPQRPYCAQASASRQIFFEHPPQRRGEGGDRWRSSGGVTRSAVHWINSNEGVRKRYGQLQRADPNKQTLSVTQFSLIFADPANPKAVKQDKSSYLFTIEPCKVDKAETLEQPLLRRGLHSSGSADAGEVCEVHTKNSLAGVAVLDFAMVKGRISNNGSTESMRGRSVQPLVSDPMVDGADLLSEFTFDGGDLRPKRAKTNGIAGWPFGQATLVKATLLSLAVMALGSYMIVTGWQLMATPSDSGLCGAQTFRPALSEHTDCTPCRDCASQGLQMLFMCSASANACVSQFAREPALHVCSTRKLA